MTNHKPLPWGGVGVGLLLLSLSSCGLYNKYDRPDVVTDDIVRDPVAQNGALQSSDTTSFGNLPWRELFTDPQLRLLIEQGLEKNPDLLNAALNVQMVNEALKCARLAFLPSIALTPQGTISKLMTDPAVTTKSYQLPISASWNVDLFGNLLNAKRSAQMQLIATKDYQTVVQCNIISGIANLYYTLLMLDRQVEIVNDMEQLTKETWEMMKFMHENRVGYRSTAVQSAEAAYYSVQAQKVDLLRQTRETENALSLLIAQPAQTIQRGKLADQSLPTTFATGVSIELLNNRADVHHFCRMCSVLARMGTHSLARAADWTPLGGSVGFSGSSCCAAFSALWLSQAISD